MLKIIKRHKSCMSFSKNDFVHNYIHAFLCLITYECCHPCSFITDVISYILHSIFEEYIKGLNAGNTIKYLYSNTLPRA